MANGESAPRVVAVILNWNSGEDTVACVESTLAQDYAALDVWVVDNGSFDGALESVGARFPSVRLVQLPQNLGYAGGNNRAIDLALDESADFVLLLNSDVRLGPSMVSLLVSHAGPTVGAVGPTVYDFEPADRVQSTGRIFDCRSARSENRTDRAQHDVRPVDAVSGCAMLMSASALRRVGRFDEDFFAYSEEVEWCIRARAAGFSILHVDPASVWHRSMSTVPGNLYFFLITRNNLWVIRKHCRGIDRILGVLRFALLEAPRSVVGLLREGRQGAAAAVIQGVGWHLGLFRANNPLTQITRR